MRGQLTDSMQVHVLEGSKMKSIGGLLDEFARVLRFPDYFGHNFNALKDCLTDLSWTGAEGHILVILDVGQLLQRETVDDLRAFFGILAASCGAWSSPVSGQGAWDRPARPFHALLQAAPGERDNLLPPLNLASGLPAAQITVGRRSPTLLRGRRGLG